MLFNLYQIINRLTLDIRVVFILNDGITINSQQSHSSDPSEQSSVTSQRCDNVTQSLWSAQANWGDVHDKPKAYIYLIFFLKDHGFEKAINTML